MIAELPVLFGEHDTATWNAVSNVVMLMPYLLKMCTPLAFLTCLVAIAKRGKETTLPKQFKLLALHNNRLYPTSFFTELRVI
jgi:hypothetical protein